VVTRNYASLLRSDDPVLTRFRNRIFAHDNDVFLIIAGKRGSTKSGSGLSLGEQIDIDYKGNTRFFLPDKLIPKNFKLLPGERLPRVFYKPSTFMAMIKTPEKFPMGSCFEWDEVGVEGDARDFAKKKNKLLKRVFQTIRSLNWFLELTAVTLKDFDIAFGRSAGFYMKCVKRTELNIKGKKVPFGKAKMYEIDVNPTTAKAYYKKFRYTDKGGQYKVLDGYYYVKKPPAYMEAPYKRYKELFQTKLYNEYSTELDDIENFYVDEKTADESDVVERTIAMVLKTPQDFFDYDKKRFILAAIQYNGEFRISSDALARKILQLLNFRLKKGEIEV